METMYERLVKAFFKVATEDESTKRLVSGEPLMMLVIPIVLNKIAEELEGEKTDEN